MNLKNSSQTKILSILFSIIFIDACGWGVVYPVFSPIFLSNSIGLFPDLISQTARNFWFGWSIAIYCIFMFVMSPMLGALADKYGRKKILILSLLGIAAGFVINALGIFFHSLFFILAGRAIAGATAGSFPIAQAAMIDMSEPSQKAARLGLAAIANGVGFACGPVIGSVFLDSTIWHGTYYELPLLVITLVALFGAVMLQYFFQETFISELNKKIDLFSGFKSFVQIFRLPKAGYYCWMLTLFMFAWVVFYTELPYLLVLKFHQTGEQVGYFMTSLLIFFTLCLLVLLPKITKMFTLNQIVIVSLILEIFFSLAGLFVSHQLGLWWLSLPIIISAPIAYVAIVTIASNHTKSEDQGKLMGATGSIIAVTWGLGPLLTSFFVGFGATIPYSICALFFLITLIFELTA